MSQPKMPSEVTSRVRLFDRTATRITSIIVRPWFFWFSLAIIFIWVPLSFMSMSPVFHAIIDTPATVVTFALIALIENAQRRDSAAMQHKLNAIAESVARLENTNTEELEQAMGIEEKESTDD